MRAALTANGSRGNSSTHTCTRKFVISCCAAAHRCLKSSLSCAHTHKHTCCLRATVVGQRKLHNVRRATKVCTACASACVCSDLRLPSGVRLAARVSMRVSARALPPRLESKLRPSGCLSDASGRHSCVHRRWKLWCAQGSEGRDCQIGYRTSAHLTLHTCLSAPADTAPPAVSIGLRPRGTAGAPA